MSFQYASRHAPDDDPTDRRINVQRKGSTGCWLSDNGTPSTIISALRIMSLTLNVQEFHVSRVINAGLLYERRKITVFFSRGKLSVGRITRYQAKLQ